MYKLRDPSSSIKIEQDRVIRYISSDYDTCKYLNLIYKDENYSKIKSFLVSYYPLNYSTFSSEKLPFVSYPFEWTPLQLFEAAKLTINLQKELLLKGLELKDASAWNIIFNEHQPKFCDLGSIIECKTKNWWAFGQFVRNFITPLLLYKSRGVLPREVFSISRDGIDVQDMKKYGLTIINVPLLVKPLFFNIDDKNHNHFTQSRSNQSNLIQNRLRILIYLDTVLDKLSPLKERKKSIWSDYEKNRSHYSELDLQQKLNFISTVSDDLSIRNSTDKFTVLDCGCNGGEYLDACNFSLNTVKVGLDIDHQALDKAINAKKEMTLFNIDFDNLVVAQGAMGVEYKDIYKRLGKFDLVLMLALVHHLTISKSIPLDVVFGSLKKFTSSHIVFEAVYETDVMANHLSSQRNRDISFLNRDAFIEKISHNFNIIRQEQLIRNDRELFLLKVKQ